MGRLYVGGGSGDIDTGVGAGSSGGGVFPQPSWSVRDWYLKGQTGDDSADGLTPATAIKTISGGIVPKWGTTEPKLPAGVVRIHQLETQTRGQETAVLNPIGQGTLLIIDGTEGQTLVGAFDLGTVTPKVYGDPGTLLQADGFPAGTAVGDLVRNESRHGRSKVHAIAGGAATLEQPLTGYDVPLNFQPNIAEVDTWTTGDAVTVVHLPLLNLVILRNQGGQDNDTGTQAMIQVIGCNICDPGQSRGDSTFAPVSLDSFIQFLDCTFEPYVNLPTTGFLQTIAINCSFMAGGTVGDGSQVAGGSMGVFGMDMKGGYVGFDCIVDGGFICSTGNCRIGRMYFTNTSTGNAAFIYPSCTVYQVVEELSGPAAKAAVWGPGAIDLFGNASWYLTGAPTWVGALYTTGLSLNSDPTGSSFTAGAVGNPYTAGIALSAANLQAAPDHSLQQPTRGAKFAFSA